MRWHDVCFTKEIHKKIQGTWIVERAVPWGGSKVTKEISEFWEKNKLIINQKEIKWKIPIYDKSKKKIIHKCSLDQVQSHTTQVYINCNDTSEGGKGYCDKSDYEKIGYLDPFDWNTRISTDYTQCSTYPNSYSLDSFSYNVTKERLIVDDSINEVRLVLKKETPMEKIDFSTIENCEDHFEDCEFGCEGLVSEDRSILEQMEGNWEIYAMSSDNSNFFHSLSKEERDEFVGKKILVTKDGFEFLTKLKSYSRYFYEYKCSSKRALIVKNSLAKVRDFILVNNPEFVFTAYNLIGEYPGIYSYIKTKQGIKRKNIKRDDIIIVVDNPCQFTIFDLILLGHNNNVMILQIAGEYLYLKKL